MNREVHVRFSEGLAVRFRGATQLICPYGLISLIIRVDRVMDTVRSCNPTSEILKGRSVDRFFG